MKLHLVLRACTQLLVAGAAIAAAADAPGAPRIVVTVQPVHALVAGVTGGVAQPKLLLPGGASPHSFALKPSQRRALQEADLVVWVGEALETFFARTLASAAPTQRVLTLLHSPGVVAYPVRRGDAFAADTAAEDAHEEPAQPGTGVHAHAALDPHVWLSPSNADAIVGAVTAALIDIDPANASRYRDNATRLQARIAALDAELAQTLAPVRDVPYIVFHDAYQGFERHYGLRAVGAVTVSPQRTPGAAHLRALRARIAQLGVRCVFSEPQFEPRLMQTVVQGTGARSGVLDPLGVDLIPGENAWFEIMQRLAASLRSCLSTS